MIPDAAILADARRGSEGLPIGFLERAGTTLPDRVSREPGLLASLPISRGVREAAASGDWRAFWTSVLSDPSAAVCVAINASCGLIRDGFSCLAGVPAAGPVRYDFGRIRAFSLDPAKGTAVIDLPGAAGKTRLIEVKLAGESDRQFAVGDAVRVEHRHGAGNSHYRLAAPAVEPQFDAIGRLESLGANEVAAVVRAQYSDHAFCGEWDRVNIGSIVRDLHPGARESRIGLYQHRQSGDAIMVFRGTQPLDVRDWATNIAATHGWLASDYRAAVAAASWARERFDRVLLAGHSKGGGAAQVAAVHTGLSAVCFNSVGLPANLAADLAGPNPNARPTIEHFAIQFDWVSNLGGAYRPEGMGAAGPLASRRFGQCMLGSPDAFHLLPTNYSRWQCTALHSIDTLINSLEERPHVLQRPFEPSNAQASRILPDDLARPLPARPRAPASPRPSPDRSAPSAALRSI